MATTTVRVEGKAAPSGQRKNRAGWPWQLKLSLALLVVIPVALALWFAIAQPVKVVPRIRAAPAFMLSNQEARWVSDEDLRGSMLLISFLYSRCGAACAPDEQQLNEVREALRASGRTPEQVRLVTISIDPTYDRPAVLGDYARRVSSEQEWLFLTGSADEVKQLVGGEFGIYYASGGSSPPESFDRQVVLIDGVGQLRAEYGANLDSARVLRDVGLIETEMSSSGAQRSVYEVAHLFLCYPD